MKSSSWTRSGNLRRKRYMAVGLVRDEIADAIEKLLRRNRLLTERRQTQGEDGAYIDLARDGNASTVGFHDLLHNGKSKPSPGGIFCPSPIGSVESLE